MQFVPLINTLAGATLTNAQWQKTGITHYAYSALLLLQRPGMVTCRLQAPGVNIVDCRDIVINAKGQIRYQVSDGSFKLVDLVEFTKWLDSLNHDEIIWPSTVMQYHITDRPALDGVSGRFYCQGATLTITDVQFEKDLGPLCADCRCATCQQLYTRAYLQHLFQHTPLLAQRYMVMHNCTIAIDSAR